MDKLEILYKSHKTLLARQESDPASFTEENVIYLGKLEVGVKKLEKESQNMIRKFNL